MKQTRFIPNRDCGCNCREPGGVSRAAPSEGQPIVFGVVGQPHTRGATREGV